MKEIKRYTVTAALPYVNSPIHIGHLAGCHLPADVYARYLRAKGEDVLFLCGSDEHGVPIMLKARQEGVNPQELIDKYHAIIKKSFEDFGISFDIYSRTSNKVHYETAQEFFLNLYNKGKLKKHSTMQFYDTKVAQFLADRYIVGTCPNCGNDRAYGDQCEKCGKSLSPDQLINPHSALSDTPVEMRETEHWFLPLQDYQKWLEEWLLVEHSDWKLNVLGQCRSWLNQGLQERSISRDMEWGVPVPLDEAKGKVLYVWFDAPIGYISAAKEWGAAAGKDWQPYWKDKEHTKLVHFLGKDNIVFHCIIFPVMLQAHGDFVLPDNVPANEFLNLEGNKISSSRNWAVWVDEYMQDFPTMQDVLRYTLIANAPETKDNDFSWKDFQAKNNNELASILGNLVNRVLVLTHKYYDGKIPAQGIKTKAEEDLENSVRLYPGLIGGLIDKYYFREALQEFMNLCRVGNKYLTDNEPWKTVKNDGDRTAAIMHYSIQLIANIAILAEPFLPSTAKKLKDYLHLKDNKWNDAGSLELVEVGTIVEPGELLFRKIEDSEIEKQLEKLNGSRQPEALEPELLVKPTIAPFKENISYDDFSKLDLRIATVKHAEKVPKTDKLLKLTIDLGSEERTIVSGIAAYYTPEQVIGRQVCIVANLAPRNLKGITSQGMILMIENENKELVFIQPEKEVGNGSGVS